MLHICNVLNIKAYPIPAGGVLSIVVSLIVCLFSSLPDHTMKTRVLSVCQSSVLVSSSFQGHTMDNSVLSVCESSV